MTGRAKSKCGHTLTYLNINKILSATVMSLYVRIRSVRGEVISVRLWQDVRLLKYGHVLTQFNVNNIIIRQLCRHMSGCDRWTTEKCHVVWRRPYGRHRTGHINSTYHNKNNVPTAKSMPLYVRIRSVRGLQVINAGCVRKCVSRNMVMSWHNWM